ncbi:hypothetical protein SDC9_49411 [bioreactor metagenome]|uniref:Uncharacterized protein n=1 Tax=bioreactor metagenome TaxID=1076179 RepID=A0A644WHA8_9ZZZZ
MKGRLEGRGVLPGPGEEEIGFHAPGVQGGESVPEFPVGGEEPLEGVLPYPPVFRPAQKVVPFFREFGLPARFVENLRKLEVGVRQKGEGVFRGSGHLPGPGENLLLLQAEHMLRRPKKVVKVMTVHFEPGTAFGGGLHPLRPGGEDFGPVEGEDGSIGGQQGSRPVCPCLPGSVGGILVALHYRIGIDLAHSFRSSFLELQELQQRFRGLEKPSVKAAEPLQFFSKDPAGFLPRFA